ncbi:MAG: hypothetical protein ABIJ21_05965 [Nanoarchaeota archaeon]
MEIVSPLEFQKKYFFTSDDVDTFAKNKTQRYNIIKNLLKKKRIVKLNRTKYYLVPVMAKSNMWSEDSFILADELFNGEGYFISGWAAANYWKLTDQIPMKIEVSSVKRQGKQRFLTTSFIFRRTSKKKVGRAVTEYINDHPFRIMNKEEMRVWMKKRR